ncbi:Pyrimidine 5'-nucleotidase YjjG [Marinomonas aquimarina]|uniref:Pyrimidine 5'-nucleotidase YjjG n=1 Tax=Marinomonas aquimarina TaxID=295068 RepID=A0A1A8TH82_9GAMM|nr:HAD family hydrolase [Marinomonas aquimarina]SBS31681.1 Pyrimidine 5'-nucleotidase YjjG [Marinomonas aquimarina]
MQKPILTTIAFDADDTLWRNEDVFLSTQQYFVEMLETYHSREYILERLNEVQIDNLSNFGYGVKGFTLSLIESAIMLTEGRITGYEIHEIIQLAKQMLAAPIQLLPGIEPLLQSLQGKCRLMVITKGDLLDQEGKLARSGLNEYFDWYEVVSNKKAENYHKVFESLQLNPSEVLMIGNSMRSDVLPVLDAGAHALHVPYHTTWSHEQVTDAELANYPMIPTVASAETVEQWIRANFQLSGEIK